MSKLSEESLSNAALFYLRRASASRRGLTQLLERKVKRHLREGGGEAGPARLMVEQVVARMVQAGYVDDAKVAAAKTASLQRQGRSSRAIELKLRSAGIEPELAKASARSTPEHELEAARALAAKKRLGADPGRKQKDFAVLLRAGFSSDVARSALRLNAAAREATAGERTPRGARGSEETTSARPLSMRPGPATRGTRPPAADQPGAQVLQLPFGGRSREAVTHDGAEVIRLPLAEPPQARFAVQSSRRSEERSPEAAAALVKKKRLGVDPARRQRDLAVLVRAGFSFDVARRALAPSSQE